MNAVGHRRILAAAAGLFLVLALPPVRRVLEAGMSLQVLVQMPLLVLVGGGLATAFPARARQTMAAWNWQGVTGLLLASGAMACWMLPRVMDAAATQAWVDTVKYLSLPLAVGVPLALSWPAAGFVVRGLFVAEAIATCFRLGGLYLAAPVRLCTIYPIGDQQRLGWWLVALGFALLLTVGAKLLFGHLQVTADGTHTGPEPRSCSRSCDSSSRRSGRSS